MFFFSRIRQRPVFVHATDTRTFDTSIMNGDQHASNCNPNDDGWMIRCSVGCWRFYGMADVRIGSVTLTDVVDVVEILQFF